MPVAGEEGYEDLVICPYDKSHEIRSGCIQFHLNRCRDNHTRGDLTQCSFNTSHIVPMVEIQFHSEEACGSRSAFDAETYQVGDTECSVKNLVPINDGIVPDGDENWDDFEATGSVLNTIKTEAAEKNIFRTMQCVSKSKRQMFRREEQLRHSKFDNASQFLDTASTSTTYEHEPLRRPTVLSTVPFKKQDPEEAAAALSKQLRSMDLKVKEEGESKYAVPETASILIGAPSTSTSSVKDEPFNPSEGAWCLPDVHPSSAMPTSSRPSTAANIAESASRINKFKPLSNGDFCTTPIPGRGRGRRAHRNMQP